MKRHDRSGKRKIGMLARAAALCLAAVPACAQTSIDTAFARKLYSARHDDLFHVGIGLKNTAYWVLNDSLQSDHPIACDKSKQDCSAEAFRLVEVIDTAKTDAFFQRHEILASADRKSILSKPPAYARNYEVYISPTEVLFCMQDSLVERMVDLGAALPVALGNGRPRDKGRFSFPDRPMGAWLLGRMIGPR